MTITRTITKSLGVVFVGAGLAASGLLLGQTWAESSSSPAPAPVPASTPAVSPSADAIPEQAAALAVLRHLCLAGQDSAQASAYYVQVAAAHPTESAQIGPDCAIVAPPVARP
jgi:hypothetical protein